MHEEGEEDDEFHWTVTVFFEQPKLYKTTVHCGFLLFFKIFLQYFYSQAFSKSFSFRLANPSLFFVYERVKEQGQL